VRPLPSPYLLFQSSHIIIIHDHSHGRIALVLHLIKFTVESFFVKLASSSDADPGIPESTGWGLAGKLTTSEAPDILLTACTDWSFCIGFIASRMQKYQEGTGCRSPARIRHYRPMATSKVMVLANSKNRDFWPGFPAPWHPFSGPFVQFCGLFVTGRLGLGAGSRELVTRRGTAQERGLEIRSVGRG
jgi:hypothetical protein